MQEGDQRIGRRAAELAAVLRPGERAHLHDHGSHAAQGDRQGRGARAHAAHVSDHHRVRGEELRLRGRVGGERAARLLLSLDHDLDAHRRLAVPGAQRSDVHQDVGLRVGGAAAEDGAVALAGLERGRLPFRLVPDRHHVVVRIQQDRGRSGRGRDLTGDDRRRVWQFEGSERFDARVAEEPDDDLVGLHQGRARRLGETGGRNARHCHESREVGLQLRHELRHSARRRLLHMILPSNTHCPTSVTPADTYQPGVRSQPTGRPTMVRPTQSGVVRTTLELFRSRPAHSARHVARTTGTRRRARPAG